MKQYFCRILVLSLFILPASIRIASASPIDLLGQWSIITGQDTLNYQGSLLEFTSQQASGTDFLLDGNFDWYRAGVFVGREIFTGVFLTDLSINLTGKQLINPIGINLANYRGQVTPDGNSIINGTWSPPPGTWTASRVLDNRAVPEPATLPLVTIALGLCLSFCSLKYLKMR